MTVEPAVAAQWVQRALGMAVPAAGDSTDEAAADWPVARADWQTACAAVDRQIAGLQAVLRASGDETLEEIAEFGLNGITGAHRVKVMAGVLEVRDGAPAAMAMAGPKLLAAVRDFQSFLVSSEAVAVCDANPFGTPVSIRDTLGAGLAALATALSAQGG